MEFSKQLVYFEATQFALNIQTQKAEIRKPNNPWPHKGKNWIWFFSIYSANIKKRWWKTDTSWLSYGVDRTISLTLTASICLIFFSSHLSEKKTNDHYLDIKIEFDDAPIPLLKVYNIRKAFYVLDLLIFIRLDKFHSLNRKLCSDVCYTFLSKSIFILRSCYTALINKKYNSFFQIGKKLRWFFS